MYKRSNAIRTVCMAFGMRNSYRAAKRANRGWIRPVRLMLPKRLKPADPAAIRAAAAVHRA